MELVELIDILACPICKGDLCYINDGLLCPECGRSYPVEDGVPILLSEGDLRVEREEHPESNNPYVRTPRDIIEECRDGIVLDHGAGHQTERYPHVLQFEMVKYPTTDVVGRAEALPFREGSFDAVYSNAVLEHVQDPRQATREIYRVTKRGGTVLIRTAFMQPFHAYPSHYFNATIEGIRQLAAGFTPIDVGCDPSAPHMLRWVLNRFLEGMDPVTKGEALRMSLHEIISSFNRNEFGPFEKITDDTHRALSPAVYFYGYK